VTLAPSFSLSHYGHVVSNFTLLDSPARMCHCDHKITSNEPNPSQSKTSKTVSQNKLSVSKLVVFGFVIVKED
jgi:hypothetical protein